MTSSAMDEVCIFKLSGTYTLIPRIILYLSWLFILGDAAFGFKLGPFTQNFLIGLMAFRILPALETFQLFHNWIHGDQAEDLDIIGIWLWLAFDMLVIIPFSVMITIVKRKTLAIPLWGILSFGSFKAFAFSCVLFLTSRPPRQISTIVCESLSVPGHPAGDAVSSKLDIKSFHFFHILIGAMAIVHACVIIAWPLYSARRSLEAAITSLEKKKKPLCYYIWLGVHLLLCLLSCTFTEVILFEAPKPLSLVDNYTQWTAPIVFLSTYLLWPLHQVLAKRAIQRQEREEAMALLHDGTDGRELDERRPDYIEDPAFGGPSGGA